MDQAFSTRSALEQAVAHLDLGSRFSQVFALQFLEKAVAGSSRGRSGAAGNGGGGGGGLAAAFEIVLLDSLYGSEAQFDGFVEAALAAGALGPGAAQARFVSVYTDGGGTEANNRAMAARAAAWLRAANASALLYYNDALDAPLPPQAVADVAVIFKRSNLTHDDTCRQYFALFVAGMRYR